MKKRFSGGAAQHPTGRRRPRPRRLLGRMVHGHPALDTLPLAPENAYLRHRAREARELIRRRVLGILYPVQREPCFDRAVLSRRFRRGAHAPNMSTTSFHGCAVDRADAVEISTRVGIAMSPSPVTRC
jgi:hypothetical protein